MNFIQKWLQIRSADGPNEIVCQIGFIVESADGLTMNFYESVVTTTSPEAGS